MGQRAIRFSEATDKGIQSAARKLRGYLQSLTFLLESRDSVEQELSASVNDGIDWN